MKMCQPHHNKLRERIVFLGLESFIATSGKDLMDSIKDQNETGKLTARNFEPLVAAYYAIFAAFIRDVAESSSEAEAMRLAATNVCPLCNIVETSDNKDLDTDWINGSAQDQLEAARHHGIVAGLQ